MKVVFFYKSISTCGVLHAGPSQGMPTLADHFIKSCMEHSLRLLLSGEDFELWVLGAYSREEPCYTAIYICGFVGVVEAQAHHIHRVELCKGRVNIYTHTVASGSTAKINRMCA